MGKYFSIYCSLSTILFAGLVFNAFRNHHGQFFPSVVQLTNSKVFGVVWANTCTMCTLLLGFVTSRIFFGVLTASERHKCVEEITFAFIDMIIATTYFTQQITTTTVRQFVIMLYLRAFHSLCLSRLESLEQTHQPPMKRFVRLIVFLGILASVDVYGLYAFASNLYTGFGLWMLFVLEYSTMLVKAHEVLLKLLVQLVDEWKGGGFEHRHTLRYFIDIVSTTLRCILYVCFFIAMTRHVLFPFHLVRELFITVRATINVIKSFARYQKIALNIDRTFPDATPEQLDVDRSCTICFDDMLDDSHCKKLPCNHVFHRKCLQRWFEKKDTCPYCSKSVYTPVEPRNVPLPMHVPQQQHQPDGQLPPRRNTPAAADLEVELEEYRRIFAEAFADDMGTAEVTSNQKPPVATTTPSVTRESSASFESASEELWSHLVQAAASNPPTTTSGDASQTRLALYEQYERDVELARIRLQNGIRQLGPR